MTTPRTPFPVKRLADGRAFANLGSSARCAPGWNNIDFSWIVRLGRHRRACALLRKWGFLSAERHARIEQLDPDMILWDLRKGVPFPDQTFDGVYHSHVLEHIDREDAPAFLRECRRVLKVGGVLRIAVPDFEALAQKYLASVYGQSDDARIPGHIPAVEAMIDQMVVREPRERRERHPLVRLIEKIVIGDTSKSGTVHRWMYDRFSLADLMREAGFRDIHRCDAVSGAIDGWRDFNLDTEADGRIYKPDSLYMEGIR